MNTERLKELINENKSIHMEDDMAQEQIWREMLAILSENIDDTMNYLDGTNKDDLSYICALFDDLSTHFQSQKLIECMERNAKRTGLNCWTDIKFAKKMLKK